ncbi:MAG: glycosyltransferase [Lachnospiraceae bacterium]|nr:glycosyltransferase [Lachnospiraceae bacterium]
MKQKRILHVINGIGTGGAEKDIVNWYRNIDREQYQFDFLIRSNEQFYRDEIEEMGGNVYVVPEFPRRFIRNIVETMKFMKRHREYVAVHVHGNALIYIIPLIIASRYKIPIRIMHVHNTKANGNMSKIVHYVNKLILPKFATNMVACSKNAGIFSYGSSSFTIIKNGIDLERFKINNKSIRPEFNIADDQIIFTHVGRFLPVKNHLFLIDIFCEIKKIKKNSVLLLVGDGPLNNEVKEYVYKEDLGNSVIFCGERKDVESILHDSDMVIFPSIYEGVPLVVLEAQASQTKVLLSDSIDKEVIITPYAKQLSLKQTAKSWAECATEFLEKKIECDVDDAFEYAGYSITNSIEKLYNLYEGLE